MTPGCGELQQRLACSRGLQLPQDSYKLGESGVVLTARESVVVASSSVKGAERCVFRTNDQHANFTSPLAKTAEEIKQHGCYRCGGPHFYSNRQTGWKCSAVKATRKPEAVQASQAAETVPIRALGKAHAHGHWHVELNAWPAQRPGAVTQSSRANRVSLVSMASSSFGRNRWRRMSKVVL